MLRRIWLRIPTLHAIAPTTLAMTDDNLLSFPAVSRKQITAAFDGGRLTRRLRLFGGFWQYRFICTVSRAPKPDIWRAERRKCGFRRHPEHLSLGF
jgi:hypothetical protein